LFVARDGVVQIRRKVFTVLANPQWQKLEFVPDEIPLSAISDIPVYNNVHLNAKQPNEEIVILFETFSLFGSKWFEVHLILSISLLFENSSHLILFISA
jgi:hypothetical protein